MRAYINGKPYWMHKNIFIELRCSMYPLVTTTMSVNRGEERIDQIYNGLKSFLDQYDKIENKERCDLFFVDNTIKDITEIPSKILDIIEDNDIKCILFDKNHYGSKNKGAGDIETWRNNIEIISDYKWILHFEPRTIINSPSFIRKCLGTPRNIFKVLRPDNTREHFYTGLFMLDIEVLKEYINHINLDDMVSSRTSIEYSLIDFMRGVETISFTDHKRKLKVKWHDVQENRFIEF